MYQPAARAPATTRAAACGASRLLPVWCGLAAQAAGA